jgi:hypothetical protein
LSLPSGLETSAAFFCAVEIIVINSNSDTNDKAFLYAIIILIFIVLVIYG